MSGVVALAFLVWGLTVAACCLFIRPCSTDMAVRYAPMAENLAAGNWTLAFHPRFCVQFPVWAGLTVWLTGIPGWRACQVVALTFWVFSSVPLWMIARRVFGRAAAWFAFAIYLLNADLFRYAAEGWRDDCRILPLLLVALAFVRLCTREDERRFPRDGLVMSVALLLLVTLRVDCILIGSVFLAVFGIWCLARGRIAAAFLSAVGWAIGIALQSWMVHAYTGWWLPAQQYIPVVARMIGGGA